uniref:Uncharacterized protein MANES_02G067600 n=1 Tax=Rhizophora mucronata TaxID=61149 RepID=A0A2P2P4Z8_RHIMU
MSFSTFILLSNLGCCAENLPIISGFTPQLLRSSTARAANSLPNLDLKIPCIS